ncbi:MAG: hypothetical protein K2N00_04470, partial [Lachnospiraceae bacterium]|nr:hypothetical protein [Lachnospiraceae bacterium]
VKGQAYSTYFYHGKRMIKARMSAIMKEDKRWDFLAYCCIGILLLDVIFNIYRIGGSLYESHMIRKEAELAEVSFYEGYEPPDAFTQTVIDEMIRLEPVSEDAYYNEWISEDIYEWKEYSELPYEAEGPWQVRLNDADRYNDAVILLLQRYVSYFDELDRASQWTLEDSWYTIADAVNSRLLAGDKNEAVFAVICKYYVGGSESDLAEFPRELKDRAQFSHEKDGYYAYFDWTLRICLVKDYVFELEGIAETQDVLQAYMEQYAQADFSDIPKIDLVYGIETASLETSEGEIDSLPAGVSENAYQVDTKEGVLQVSGADGKWQEVPVTLEELFDRGDEMNGHSLTTGAKFINNSVGFMTIRSSEEPDIWRTQDGGKTWEYQELTDAPEYYSIAYAPEVHGDILCLYVGMEDYSEYGGTKAKYESADEGRTWEYKGLVVRK